MSDLTPTYFVIYRTSDGQVLQAGMMPKDAIASYPSAGLPSGHAIMEVSRMADLEGGEWIVGGVLTPGTDYTPVVSAASIPADATTTSTVSGLPNPCKVSLRHSSHTVPDPVANQTVTTGSVTVKSGTVGTITLYVSAPGTKNKKILIDVV